MAKDRIEPCESYICKGECKKGREADHNGYCQKCDKYRPRVRRRRLNKKKQELEKIFRFFSDSLLIFAVEKEKIV